jgi:hypothetical protein
MKVRHESEPHVYPLRNYTIKKQGDQDDRGPQGRNDRDDRNNKSGTRYRYPTMAGQTHEPPEQHLAAQFLRHQ